MLIRNKKTGEIKDLDIRLLGTEPDRFVNSIAELSEEWEDYEEDELLYIISAEHKSGYQCVLKEEYPEICEVAKELGIGFETEEEAEKAVEKLKAWKRLKDKGFRFTGVDSEHRGGSIAYRIDVGDWDLDVNTDLDLLFGGEE